MNKHLKQLLKGVLILFWMIIYWVFVGVIPRFAQDFYEQYHNELFQSTIAFSLLIYLILVSYYYRNGELRSLKGLLLAALPYLFFLLFLIVYASNVPRITDVFLLAIGILSVYLMELNNYTKKTKVFLLIILAIVIIPVYSLIYSNIWYYVNKSEIRENQKLGNFNLKITNREGKSFYINELAGSTVCIDMWASSCGNCIASMPDFEKLNQNFKSDKEYKIISLYCPIKEEQTFEWFKEYIDRKFDYDIDYYYIDYESFNKLNIRQFPEFLIVSKQSNLVYRGQISYLSYVSDNIYSKLKSINENY
jgi:thiol-disulfide isomerase/thioredoxin